MSLISHDVLRHELGVLASRQRGLVTTEQAHRVGATAKQIEHYRRVGDLQMIAPRIYALRGVPLTDRTLLHAAYLEASGHSAVCRQSAAAIWRFSGFSLRPFHIARRRDGTFPPGVLGIVHTTRRLPDQHLTRSDGLLVTTPTRTLFDLAPLVHPARLERLIDRTWSRRLTSGALLRRTFEEMRGRGQSGIAVMRPLLDVRGDDYRPPDSGLEARCGQILEEYDLTGFERQVDLGDTDGFIGRVDLVHRKRRVILEVDSDLFHTSISDVQHDQDRQRRLEAAGWIVVRVTEFEVWHRPAVVAGRVRDAVAGRRRRRRHR